MHGDGWFCEFQALLQGFDGDEKCLPTGGSSQEGEADEANETDDE